MNKDFKNIMLEHEKYLNDYATFSSQAVRLKKEEEDIRPPFFHDTDRIIHSLAYTRYIDKTQVFSNSDSDHISKRIVHVSFVSKIARTIGRALKLNEDLIEAIALGHDLGHVPFGHVGEAILNEICIEYNNTYFNHNVQSVRQLMVLENNGLGANLTLQTLDGILCHNGEMCFANYKPVNKTAEQFKNEYNNTYIDKTAISKLIPMTLEGCVVRISDIIAYIGRDVEDAIRLNIIKKEDLPSFIKENLGTTNKEIINNLILDIINNSYEKPYIKMSDEIFEALKMLKDFNYKNIYSKANTKEQVENYKLMFKTLYLKYIDILEKEDKENDIYKDFLNEMGNEYLDKSSKHEKVVDYIAGMTDKYFLKQYEKYSCK